MKNITVLFLFLFSLLVYNNVPVRAQSDDWQVIKLADGVNIQDFVNGMGLSVDEVKIGVHGYIKIPGYVALTMNHEEVTKVESDAEAVVQATIPDDFFYESDQWNMTKIGLEQVWDDYRGNDELVVAVLDTGLNLDHEDMQGLVWINEDETDNNDKDDDGNGYIDDIYGYNLIKESPNINDDNDHGTAVNSIIAARTDNEIGIAGVNWRVKLMQVKVASASGTASLYDIAQGIYYAVDNGANVINMSLGSKTDRDFLYEAVRYAYDNDVLMVAASGNSTSTSSPSNYVLYPASYDEVMAVGATDMYDEVANLSNSTFISHSGNNLDLVAPGVEILTADGNSQDGYKIFDGTSMATPHVAGVAALMLSKDPNLTADEIRQILIESANNPESMSGDFDQKYGNGRLDAQAAMDMVNEADGDDDDGPDYPTGDDEFTYLTSLVSVSNDWYMRPFETREAMIAYKNIGDGFWPVRGDEVVRMGTANPLDRASLFYDSANWLTTNRISAFNVEEVGPGEEIVFKFSLSAPGTVGDYQECFALVWEGNKWFDDTQVCMEVHVTNDSVYSAAWYNQSDYLTMEFGESGESWLEFVNNGTVVWERSGPEPMHLGTDRPLDRYSLFHDSATWLSDNRVELDQANVQPGEVGRFTFDVQARAKGIYSEYFRPVVEGVQWMPDYGVFLQYTVG